MTHESTAFIFPGQGESHYVGMGKDFYEQYECVRALFDKASSITGLDLKKLIFEGPLEEISKTNHCQLAIFLVSLSVLEVLREECPDLKPKVVGGLSLGEYTAATAAGVLTFEEGVRLVFARGSLMQKACDENPSTMAVVLGLDEEQVKEVLKEVNCPDDLWIANLNCPGQIVVSGTQKGIDQFMPVAKEKGAKRVLPLNVAGAFHSPLMLSAAQALKEQMSQMTLKDPQVPTAMNATGTLSKNVSEIKPNLIEQITHSVRWNDCIQEMEKLNIEHYIEIGPGKVLAGLNKRIKVQGKTTSVGTIEEMQALKNQITEMEIRT